MFFINKITLSLLLLSSTIIIGALGFSFIDKYPFIDALYMSVITITTVGFGEIYPLSEWGRLFTVVFILLGFVVLGFVGHSIVESLLEKVWSGNVLEKRMKKQVASLTGHHIICGFGRVGEVASEHLEEAGADFVVIDAASGTHEKCQQKGVISVEGDATRESVLLEAGIKKASGLLALVDSDPLNLFIVLTARELNPTLHIIARSEEKQTEKKILRAGADSIISPFDSAGRQIAGDLLTATGKVRDGLVQRARKTTSLPEWVVVGAESDIIGKSIHEVEILLACEVLGLRNNTSDLLQPTEDIVVKQDDQLFVVSNGESDKCLAVNGVSPRKIVIVDDNPVIIRLFTRLFQKEGYHPFSATNGEEGFELILQENPSVAVIDYMLPGISGLDICRKLRAINFGDQLKLIVFTAENNGDLRRQCLEAGADAVIVKSSEAQEIIKTVRQMAR
jgi:voltage-gated potassium channel